MREQMISLYRFGEDNGRIFNGMKSSDVSIIIINLLVLHSMTNDAISHKLNSNLI